MNQITIIIHKRRPAPSAVRPLSVRYARLRKCLAINAPSAMSAMSALFWKSYTHMRTRTHARATPEKRVGKHSGHSGQHGRGSQPIERSPTLYQPMKRLETSIFAPFLGSKGVGGSKSLTGIAPRPEPPMTKILTGYTTPPGRMRIPSTGKTYLDEAQRNRSIDLGECDSRSRVHKHVWGRNATRHPKPSCRTARAERGRASA